MIVEKRLFYPKKINAREYMQYKLEEEVQRLFLSFSRKKYVPIIELRTRARRQTALWQKKLENLAILENL